MTQEVLHSKVTNIEDETHRISNRQLVYYSCSIIMAVAIAVGWWFTQKQASIDDKNETVKMFNSLKSLIRENHLKDSIDFIKLNDKFDAKEQLSNQRFLNLEGKRHKVSIAYPKQLPAAYTSFYPYTIKNYPFLVAAK